LAGDSTITSDLLIASLHFRLLSVPAADLPVRLVLTTLLFPAARQFVARSPAISERYSIFPAMGSRSLLKRDPQTDFQAHSEHIPNAPGTRPNVLRKPLFATRNQTRSASEGRGIFL
jgi:hypothetical protein